MSEMRIVYHDGNDGWVGLFCSEEEAKKLKAKIEFINYFFCKLKKDGIIEWWPIIWSLLYKEWNRHKGVIAKVNVYEYSPIFIKDLFYNCSEEQAKKDFRETLDEFNFNWHQIEEFDSEHDFAEKAFKNDYSGINLFRAYVLDPTVPEYSEYDLFGGKCPEGLICRG